MNNWSDTYITMIMLGVNELIQEYGADYVRDALNRHQDLWACYEKQVNIVHDIDQKIIRTFRKMIP